MYEKGPLKMKPSAALNEIFAEGNERVCTHIPTLYKSMFVGPCANLVVV